MSRIKSPEINAYTYGQLIFDKVQFSHSVTSDSLGPHGLQQAPVHHQLLEFTPTHVH